MNISPVKHCLTRSNSRFIAAFSSCRGLRPSNEDAFLMDIEHGIFAIFDGHDGTVVCNYLEKEMGRRILSQVEKMQESSPASMVKKSSLSDAQFQDIFLSLDATLKKYMKDNRRGYIESRKKFFGGSTSVLVLVDRLENESALADITCINSGDSRSFFIPHDQACIPLSHDHKTPGESSRIEKAGGRVLNNRVYLSQTSNLSMGVCRGFGDFTFKANENLKPADQIVTVLPDVKRVKCHHSYQTRIPGAGLIVLGCDGLFDVLNNDQVKNMITNFLMEVDLFDGKPLTAQQMEPVAKNQCFLYKDFREWGFRDVASYMSSLGQKFVNVLEMHDIFDGPTLFGLANGTISRSKLMERGHAQSIGIIYDTLIPHLREELQRQQKWHSRSPPCTTEEKLLHLTNQIIDVAIYFFNSTDNVSVMLVVLQDSESSE